MIFPPFRSLLPKSLAAISVGLLVQTFASPGVAGEVGACLDLHNDALEPPYNCTANDGGISSINALSVIKPCLSSGDTGEFEISIEILGGNANERYDYGLFLNLVGADAKTDTTPDGCYQEWLPDPQIGPLPSGSETNPFGPFLTLEPSYPNDICGDLNALNTSAEINSSPTDGDRAEVALRGNNASGFDTVSMYCSDSVDGGGFPNADGLLDASACAAYSNQANKKSGDECVGFGDGTDTNQAGSPLTKSKCGCNELNVAPPTPIPDLSLSCNCTYTGTPGEFDCSVSLANGEPANLAPIDPDAENSQQAGTAAYFNVQVNDFTDYAGTEETAASGEYEFQGNTNGSTDIPTLDPPDLLLTPEGGRCGPGECDGDSAPEPGVLGPGETAISEFRYSNTTADAIVTLETALYWDSDGDESPDTRVETNADCQVLASSTYAAIGDVSARFERGEGVVVWETLTEAGTESFVLQREAADGRFVDVTDEPVMSVGEFGGAEYQVPDPVVGAMEPVRYRILEHEVGGRMNVHGPYNVVVEPGQRRGQAIGRSAEGDERGNSGQSQARAKQPDARVQARFAESRRASEQHRNQSNGTKKGHARQGSGANEYSLSSLSVTDPAPGTPALKLPVEEDGLFQVETSTIAAALGLSEGEAVQLIRKGRVEMTNEGEAVAWEPGPGDASIRFYGQGNKGPYSRTNVYWLTEGRGDVLVATSGASAPAVFGQTFAQSVHAEKNLVTRPFAVPAPDDDFTFWGFASFGASFELETPGAAPVPDNVTLHFNAPHTEESALIDIKVNGQSVGRNTWVGPNESQVTFPQHLLQDINTIETEGISGLFVVDSLDIRYRRLYRTSENTLEFHGDGNASVSVSGFSTPDIAVYDVSEPKQPVRIRDLSIESGDGGYRVSMRPDAPDRQYLAVAGPGVRSTEAVQADLTPVLRDPSNRGDYLIVAPEVLLEGARALGDYYASEDATPYVAVLSDIMDEFNDGNFDPHAIRDFVAYASKEWQLPPRGVALLGKGHSDYLDEQGFGGNLLPPIFVRTANSYVAADNLFGDVNGDGIGDVPIGRIPALLEQDVFDYVEKLESYRDTPSGTWSSRALVVADNNDPRAGNFPADSRALSALLPADLEVEETFLYEDYTRAEARERLVDSGINQGALFVNLMGHGAPVHFTDERLLSMNDVPLLSNGGRLPVVNALSCLIGTYFFPGWQTLAEDLVLHREGGAIAVWGPMGLSNNRESAALGRQLATTLFDGAGETIGERYVRAVKAYIEDGGNPELAATYSLLGDPFIQLKTRQ